MTEEIFRENAYARECAARVLEATGEGVVLDRTVFYPAGGGQPGDTRVLRAPDGNEVRIVDTRTGDSGILHVAEEGAALPAPGTTVTAAIDWDRRHRLMRMHTCLHLLCAVVPGGVTGGQVGVEKSRLDFNLPDTTLDKEHLAAELNRLIAEDHPVGSRWITDEELAAQPELVRTMSVQPPTGQGLVRLLDVDGVDLQPCGGTHVQRTGEIGRIIVRKIENKGKRNRRVVVALAE